MTKTRLAALFTTAAFIAGCLGACGNGGAEEVTIEADTPPKEMVEAATFEGIHSGVVEGTFETLNSAAEDELDVHLTVGFDDRGAAVFPPFFVSVGMVGRRDGQFIEFNGRIFHLPHHEVSLVYGPAFKEKTYQVKKKELGGFEGKVENAQAEGGPGALMACLRLFPQAHSEMESVLSHLTYEGSRVDPYGARIFLVSGKLDVAALIDLLARMAEDPLCGSQMRALRIPSAAELKAIGSELHGDAEEGEITIGIDKHGLPRFLEAATELAGSEKGTHVKLKFWLKEVNEPLVIFPAEHGKPLDRLLRTFGVSPTEAHEANGDEILIGLLEGFSVGITGRLP